MVNAYYKELPGISVRRSETGTIKVFGDRSGDFAENLSKDS